MIDRNPGIRPRESVWREIDIAARAAFPATTTALLLLLSATPLGLPGQAELQGPLALACVVFWSLYRPDAMSPIAVFVLGLLVDLIGYGPPGVSMVVLLATYGVAQRGRRVLVRGGFVLVWLAFAGLATLAVSAQWALTCLWRLTLLPAEPVLLQAAFAAGLYPPLALMLTRAQQSLAAPERA